MDKIQQKYGDLYKSRQEPNVTQKGKKLIQENRKHNRETVLMKKRKIDVSIAKLTDKTDTTSLLERLKAWKEQKKREQLEKKAREKPVFKVPHVSLEIGMPNLETVNKTIKGKAFNSSVSKKKTWDVTRHPVIVLEQPTLKRQDAFDLGIQVLLTSTGINKRKPPPGTVNNQVPGSAIAHRLRSRARLLPDSVKRPDFPNGTRKKTDSKNAVVNDKKDNRKVKDKSLSKTKKVERKIVDERKSVVDEQTAKSPKKRMQSYENDEPEFSSPKKRIRSQSTSASPLNNKTPPKTPIQQELASSYISPYVTISRGKSNARKEFKLRTSQGGLFDKSPQYAKATGPKAGAAYFHTVLDTEIARIEKMCEEWDEYKENENPAEEACDMINMAIGQSKLLLAKKFKQFRSLIEDCESESVERPVTCSDLHGFWETAYLQVENVNKRFENLENLKENNWEEILPERQEPKKPAAKKKRVKNVKKDQVQSALKDLIKAQRQKVKDQAPAEDVIFSPSVVLPKLCVRVGARKSLAAVIMNEVKKRNSSPGLAMIRAAKMGRRTMDGVTSESSPAKSILKTPRLKSTSKKSVLFKTKNNLDDVELLDGITPPTMNNSVELTPASTQPQRRFSRRLSRATLQFLE